MPISSSVGINADTQNPFSPLCQDAPVVITNKPVGGNIGPAASTVNASSFGVITQTTAGQSITLPNPSRVNAGRLFALSSSPASTVSFTFYGLTVAPGQSAIACYSNGAWSAGVVAINGGGAAPVVASMQGQKIWADRITDLGDWILLDGRAKSTLTPAQQTVATSLGYGATIPDMRGKFPMGASGVTYPLNTTGGSFTIAQDNLPNATLPTVAGGGHTHSYLAADGSSTQGVGTGSRLTNEISILQTTRSTTGTGNHTHNVLLNGGVPQTNFIQPYATGNWFVWLGPIGAGTVTLSSGSSSSVTKAYPASEALVKGDILEVWNDAGTLKVRKAAQITNTVGPVFNQALSSSTAGRTATYTWQQNATTFRTYEVVYSSSSSFAVNSWSGTYGAGAFSTFTQFFNGLTFNGTYNLSASDVYQGLLADNWNNTGNLLWVLPGDDGLYLWRCNRDGTGWSAHLKVDNVNYQSAYAYAIGPDEFLVYGCRLNGNVMQFRVDISSGNPVAVISNVAIGGSNGNAVGSSATSPYIATASGTTRWGFYIQADTAFSAYTLYATAGVTGSNALPTQVTLAVGNVSANFGTCLGVVYKDSTRIILAMMALSGTTMRLVSFTPTGANAGTWSTVATFTAGLAGYHSCVPLTGSRFLLFSQATNASSILSETFTIDPATLATSLTGSQTYALPVSTEKEIITGSQICYDSSGNGILSIASSNDPHFVVGFTNAFIGTVNQNPIGLAKDAIASGATGDVSLSGDIITGLSGLTPGTKYYMNTTTGARQTTATTVPIGQALTATELQVKYL